ncbi:FAD-dependent oxidoreductase [candidate division KSB1 bacterium]|nr:FAD-dependent oxidoreductase [candidate division KSB1 bacterium]
MGEDAIEGKQNIVIIGAGPAGLTCAYELSKHGNTCVILESDHIVGGISRTVEYDGFRFDIGGHRFFTKVPYIQNIWREILGEEFLTRQRKSRIFYNGRFFDYPLTYRNALHNLGIAESVRIFASYLAAKGFPHRREDNFEQWVSNRFGKRLYEIFFKTYTEKVWGIPCDQLSSHWAAQRIKNLSLSEALKNAIFNRSTDKSGEVITSLIEEFFYPRYGPGMIWQRCREKLEKNNSRVEPDHRVNRIYHEHLKIRGVQSVSNSGETFEHCVSHLINSMPLRHLIFALDPPPSDQVLKAASELRYRDYFTVILIINKPHIFEDNWLYIHSADVLMGRVQNYKNWSPDMVPDASKTSLGLEYFLWKDDPLWNKPDAELIQLGMSECVKIGLVAPEDILDGTLVRMEKAYPVYDAKYDDNLDIIRNYLSSFENLQTIGRNGLHRYNNQDHSMLTGIYAARNLYGATHNIWKVNTEKSYLEESERKDSADRLMEDFLKQEFAYLDAPALGISIAVVFAFLVFMVTLVAWLVHEKPLISALSLLNNYLVGYRVSPFGAVLGGIETGILGFVLGYIFAGLRNLGIKLYAKRTKKYFESLQHKDILS